MLPTETLRNVPILEDLEDSLLRLLIVRSRVADYAAGQVLMTEGDESKSLDVLLEGKVSVERRCSSGGMVRLAERGAGDCFGEMSLIDGGPRSASVVALEDCKVLEVNQEAFTSLILAHPRAALAIMRTLVRRLREQSIDLAESKGA